MISMVTSYCVLQSDLPGFYDPCPGQDKSLYIRYTFRNRPHQVTYDDKDPIRLPLQSKNILILLHLYSGPCINNTCCEF